MATTSIRCWRASAQNLVSNSPLPHNLSKLGMYITLYNFLQLVVGYLSTLDLFKLTLTSRTSWLVTRGNRIILDGIIARTVCDRYRVEKIVKILFVSPCQQRFTFTYIISSKAISWRTKLAQKSIDFPISLTTTSSFLSTRENTRMEFIFTALASPPSGVFIVGNVLGVVGRIKYSKPSPQYLSIRERPTREFVPLVERLLPGGLPKREDMVVSVEVLRPFVELCYKMSSFGDNVV